MSIIELLKWRAAIKKLIPVIALPVSYRSESDTHSKEIKIRKTINNFVLEL